MPGSAASSPVRAVLLTGASGGIGRALALAYAAPGVVLHLGGRDAGRLAATAVLCRGRGAEVVAQALDVTDAAAMAAWVAAADARSPLDVVVANAGIYAGRETTGDEPADQARAVFDTNLTGVLNTVLPALPPLRARGHGQIVIISSLAGFRGFGTMPAYAASKAAVRVWGEGLRQWLAPEGVGVTVVCPGHVRTPLCGVEGDDVVPVDTAAQLIRDGVDANRPRVAFPTGYHAREVLVATIPPEMVERLRRFKRRR